MRKRKHHLICGNIIKLFTLIEGAMAKFSSQRLKIARTSGQNDVIKAIGLSIPGNAVVGVLDAFKRQTAIDTMDEENEIAAAVLAGPGFNAPAPAVAQTAVKSEVSGLAVKDEKVKSEKLTKAERKTEVKPETKKTEIIEISDSD